MARRYPTDPDDPGFPHGTLHGRNGLNCGCGRCCAAVLRARKASKLRRLTGTFAPTDLIDATTANRHVKQLAAAYTPAQIIRMTGVHATLIRQILNGTEPRQMTVRSAALILRTTDADAPTCQPVDSARFFQRTYSLAAMGYPLSWLAEQIGYRKLPAPSSRPGTVRYAIFARLDVLYQQIGHIPAENHPGCAAAQRSMSNARAAARRNGYFPPGCYDDDGTLLPEAIRDEEVEEKLRAREDLAQLRLDVLWLALKKHMIVSRIASSTGTTRDNVRIILKREAGLRWHTEDRSELWLVLDEGSVERGAHIETVLDAKYRRDEHDPYETCKELGLMTGARFSNIDVFAAQRRAHLLALAA